MTQSQDPFKHSPDRQANDQQLSRMGGIMMMAGWIVFFGLLTMFFSNYLNPRSKGRITSTGDRVVTVYRNINNQYLSQGKINGKDVVYLIDTGASGISIPTKVARRLGLRAGAPSKVITANGIGTVYLTTVKQLELGPIIIKNIRAHINPGLTDNQILLGMRVLRQLDIRIKGNTMTLRQNK
ncbi:hypothetical protein MNBD_GAMMA12-2994 [hydrothermal vent metagenome]|uniref:Aspartyl protease n=1 Tax=hydrothermal vent metagenome TaxID=652676 RepID=A0A3B0XWS6_9ZZZZ